MKTPFSFLRLPLLAGTIAFAGLVGCDTAPNSAYTPDNLVSDADPKVATIESVEKPAFAGIDILTLKGENFSTNLSKTFVYFTFYLPDVDDAGNIKLGTNGKPLRGKVKDTVAGTILEATTTQLKVRPPARPTFDPAQLSTRPVDDVDVRVTVLGAENFSSTIKMDLPPSFEPVPIVNQKLEDIYALTTDTANNAYVFLLSDSAPAGFFKVTPQGVRTTYATAASIGTLIWSDLAYTTADSYLYGVRNQRAIFRFKQSGSQETYFAVPTALESSKLATLTFDAKGNLWTAGNNLYMYRIAPDKTSKEFAFAADVRALRIANNYLYALAKKDGKWGIWRFAIDTSSNLGAAEQYIAFSDFGAADEALSLAIATNGDMFVGTNRNPDPILLVTAAKAVSPLYTGIFSGVVRGMSWRDNPNLLVGQGATSAVKANLLSVNTRHDGVR